MSKKDEQEFEQDPLIMSDQAKQALAKDPELADAMKELGALLRQAYHAWQSGQYPTFEDAARALGFEPEPLDEDDPDFDYAVHVRKEFKDKE